MASQQKLDLEKLRQAMTTRNQPSEAGGLKTQEYGTSYKSPYSKISAIPKRPSAPSVLVNTPPAPKPPPVSAYSQVGMNKGRKSILRSKRRSGAESTDNNRTSDTQAPTKLTQRIAAYFNENSGRKSADIKPKAAKIDSPKYFVSPLMNAPSLLAQYAEKQKAEVTSSPSPTTMPPPPLIPPKPAKTENLPTVNLAKHRLSYQPEEIDALKGRTTSGRVSFFSQSSLTQGHPPRPKKISLVLDTGRAHSIRDGSIDIDLDDIATAQVEASRLRRVGEDYGSFDSENEPIDYFKGDKWKQMQDIDDSLIDIRPRKHDWEETSNEWSTHRNHFIMVFVVYLTLTCLVLALTFLFVFKYNYGVSLPSPELAHSDPKLYEHLHQRYLLNIHMLIMIDPCLQLLQFSSLLYRIFPGASRTKMKWVHGVASLCAVFARIAGIYFSVTYHSISTAKDFYSMHDCIGVLSILIQLVGVSTGIVFVLPCCSWETRVNLTNVHRNFGNLIIISDTATVTTGIVQMSIHFFKHTEFPQMYPDPYEKVTVRSAVLNTLGFAVFAAAASTMYLQAHYQFRRRRNPGADKVRDLDLEAISRVTERRQHKALAIEAKELGKASKDLDDVQIGSRKSFNLAGKHKYWYLVASKGEKSIPALINESQKQKSNFTDTDILLALE